MFKSVVDHHIYVLTPKTRLKIFEKKCCSPPNGLMHFYVHNHHPPHGNASYIYLTASDEGGVPEEKKSAEFGGFFGFFY